MGKYNPYPGKFPCHRCKEIVTEARLYLDTKDITWMCSKKHLSRVPLKQKKGY